MLIAHINSDIAESNIDSAVIAKKVKSTNLKKTKPQKLLPFFSHKNVALYESSVLRRSLLAPQSLDLIITSPPYNVGIEYNSNDDKGEYEAYLDFCEKWLKNCYVWAKDGGRFCLNIPLDKNKGGQQSVGADITNIAKKNRVEIPQHNRVE